MGIKNLLPTLRKEIGGDWEQQLGPDDLRGKRVAVDVASFYFGHQMISSKLLLKQLTATQVLDHGVEQEELARMTLESLTSYFSKIAFYLDMKVILVFDGVSDQAKWEHVGDKRKKARERGVDKAEQLRQQYLQDPSESILDALRTSMSYVSDSGVRHNDPTGVIDYFRDLGYSCLQANGEAERLCVALWREAQVDYVLSKDSDCLTHGCKRLLTKLDDRGATWVNLDLIIERLNLDLDQFLHYCIMLGCDYNNNIPGVGPKRALALLRKYGSIDCLPPEYDTTLLNLDKCLELFDQSLTVEELTAIA